jgi:hypothetical protein
VADHTIARAALRAAEQEPLALVMNVDVRHFPIGAAWLVSTGKHDLFGDWMSAPAWQACWICGFDAEVYACVENRRHKRHLQVRKIS